MLFKNCIRADEGQITLKINCQNVNSSKKTEQMNSFLILCDVLLFDFWKKLKSSKRLLEIIWPLADQTNMNSRLVQYRGLNNSIINLFCFENQFYNMTLCFQRFYEIEFVFLQMKPFFFYQRTNPRLFEMIGKSCENVGYFRKTIYNLI